MTKTCCCIGCGGIGSYFASFLDKLIETKQTKDWEFTFYDFDRVETKNLLYQNFKPSDINDLKTDALSFKYLNIKFISASASSKTLAKYDLVIICADNNVIRKDIYASGKTFIDARSNGKTIGIYSSATENYLGTLSASDESSSCQYPYSITKEEIEYGNVIVAAILCQKLLTYIRSENLPVDFIHSF